MIVADTHRDRVQERVQDDGVFVSMPMPRDRRFLLEVLEFNC